MRLRGLFHHSAGIRLQIAEGHGVLKKLGAHHVTLLDQLTALRKALEEGESSGFADYSLAALTEELDKEGRP